MAMLWDGKEFSDINCLYGSMPLKTVLSLSNKKKQITAADDLKGTTDTGLVNDFINTVLTPTSTSSALASTHSPTSFIIYDDKDKMRIEDILKLSPSQRVSAATRMAKLIQDKDKMRRRTSAAKHIAGENSDIFKAFEPYAQSLGIDTTHL